MSAISVTFDLPEELVEQANKEGLLTDETIAALLSTEIQRKQAYDTFFTTIDQLHAVSEPLSEAEVAELVEREIEAYRAEKRQKRDATN